MTRSLFALLLAATLASSDVAAAEPVSDVNIARWIEDALVRDSSRAPDSAEALYDRVGGRPDLAIAREASNELRAEMGSSLHGLFVSSHAGIVTLRGRADSPAARDRAERLAADVRGVLEVRNALALADSAPVEPAPIDVVVSPGVAGPLTFVTGELLGGTDVGALVRDGRVTLTGLVNTPDARDWVLRQVRRLPGVRVVDNRLEVRDGSPEEDRRLEIIVYRKLERTMALWDVFRGLAYTVRSGVIRIAGTVNTEEQRELVELLAAGTSSIIAVESLIDVDPAFRLPPLVGQSERGLLDSRDPRRPRTTYQYGNYQYGSGQLPYAIGSQGGR